MLLGNEVQRARRQRAAVAAIESCSGEVEYSPKGRIPNAALSQIARRWLGSDYVDRVGSVYLRRRKLSDLEMEHLRHLTSLRSLDLGYTKITDAGLAELAGLTEMDELSLMATAVTDAGLVHLERMTALRLLSLSATRITDNGLAYLKRLPSLESLDLVATGVTDDALGHLAEMKHLKSLNLEGTRFTTKAVLRELTKVRTLESLHTSDLRLTRIGPSTFEAEVSASYALKVRREMRHRNPARDTDVTDIVLHDLQGLQASGLRVTRTGQSIFEIELPASHMLE